MEMTEKEKMLSGGLYRAVDSPEILEEVLQGRDRCRAFREIPEREWERRYRFLKEWLGAIGTGSMIQPPFYCDFGSNLYIGDRFCSNFGLVVLDVCRVTIGDDVLFGPGVKLFAAGHPLDAEVRASGLEFGAPIHIGNRVWLGGGVIVNPGVSIGDRSVIGSGSVVTRDIPPDVVAVGNPCRVLRKITEEECLSWRRLAAAYDAGEFEKV